jgi:hypothetical protein
MTDAFDTLMPPSRSAKINGLTLGWYEVGENRLMLGWLGRRFGELMKGAA